MTYFSVYKRPTKDGEEYTAQLNFGRGLLERIVVSESETKEFLSMNGVADKYVPVKLNEVEAPYRQKINDWAVKLLTEKRILLSLVGHMCLEDFKEDHNEKLLNFLEEAFTDVTFFSSRNETAVLIQVITQNYHKDDITYMSTFAKSLLYALCHKWVTWNEI